MLQLPYFLGQVLYILLKKKIGGYNEKDPEKKSGKPLRCGGE